MAPNPTTNGDKKAKVSRKGGTRAVKDTLILYKADADGTPDIVYSGTNADTVLTMMGEDGALKLKRVKPKIAAPTAPGAPAAA